MKNKVVSILIFILFILVNCKNNTLNLNYKGKNISELEKVIIYFEKEGNEEKLNAAIYLIENLEENLSPSKKNYELYEPLFDLFDSLNKHNINNRKINSNNPIDLIQDKWDSIQKTRFPINEEYTKDIDVITSKYIIDNVNMSYKVWKENTWCKHVKFSDFCEYILPYKVFDEPFEQWREYFIKRYSWLQDSLRNKCDPVEACKLINEDVSRWFKFNSLFYEFPYSLGFSLLIKGKVGVCPQMVVITAYAARAVGIPVAIDYIPNYGNRRSKHMWLAVLDTNNNFVPFNAAEAEWLPFGAINCNNTWRNKFTKIFRKTYSIQKSSLEVISKNEEIPSLFKDNKFIDVTAEYMPVKDITVNFEKQQGEYLQFAYLCIFNNKEWIPIHWGKIINNKVIFTNMGKDVVYLPTYFIAGQLIPANKPFVVNIDGSIQIIQRYKGMVQSIKLFEKYPWYITQRKDTTNKILKDDIYQLYYWENEWKLFGTTSVAKRDSIIKKLGFDFHIEEFIEGTKSKEFIFFKDVPVGVLFWLKDISRGNDERIFTITTNGDVNWW
jgi:hypothetical protein